MERRATRILVAGREVDVPWGVFSDGQFAMYDAATSTLLGATPAPAGAVDSVASGSPAIVVAPNVGNVLVGLDEAELEVGGAQELNVGGLAGVLQDPQRADVLVTPGGDIALTGTTGAAGDVMTADGAGNASMQPSAFVNAEYYNTTSDDSWTMESDDFTTTTLNARWSFVDHNLLPIASSGPCNFGSGPAANQILVTPKFRDTWLAFQAQNSAGARMLCSFVRGTAFQWRWRAQMLSVFNVSGYGNSNDSQRLTYTMYKDVAGAPDRTIGLQWFQWYLPTPLGGGPPGWYLRVREFNVAVGIDSWVDIFLAPAYGLFVPSDYELIITVTAGLAVAYIKSPTGLIAIPGPHGPSIPSTWVSPSNTSGQTVWLELWMRPGVTPLRDSTTPAFLIDYLHMRPDTIIY